MKNEHLVMEILREIARNAGQTSIRTNFAYWDSEYHGERFNGGDGFIEVSYWLDRLKGCLEEEEIKKIFDEAEEDYRVKVDPEVWAKFKNNEQPAESGRPVCRRCGGSGFVD
jgi:hypothetical protein